jgi:hypothetical protein
VYVFSLPPGPIWLLHAFHLVTTGLMLVWYLRYERRPRIQRRMRVTDTMSAPRPYATVHEPIPR